MPQRRRPIFHRVSNLLKVPILRRPIIQKLKFRTKPRKSKRLELLRHYNYRFLEEYQFSPPTTPLIRRGKRRNPIDNAMFRRVFWIFFPSRCIGGLKEERVLDARKRSWIEVETLPCAASELSEPLDYFGEDDYGDDSIDLRAEMFIERFYGEMRMESACF
ncbi:PREDICTED: uncharacterized protein LOC104821918 [Tarenaya hassleriana]|uniref:uncharacterized protein LOC104821918 n=1 Tax=Tarenaya hassleriana TaxID=28532 RepID=UPI00053C9079|nr:PREDICTED: uncharacterized protein LOC104821918 [Tarenaya hassleriana]